MHLAGDAERTDLILGDAGTETLPGILINTFDGDTAPLRALAEQLAADSFVRHGALMVLAYLTRAGRLPEAETHAYLAGLFTTMQPQSEDFVWSALVMAVGMLGYADLTAKVEAAFASGSSSPRLWASSIFARIYGTRQRTPARWMRSRGTASNPWGRAVEVLKGWSRPTARTTQTRTPRTRSPTSTRCEASAATTHAPAAAGKKYKKCCMV